ncbi:putative adhesin [Polymorphospora lycopeni]|uniref:Adhesin n=1 Tax=Polymorphospora lycopeni TaxID=3140240 RepID=A0ABV5CSB5_9ACTN
MRAERDAAGRTPEDAATPVPEKSDAEARPVDPFDVSLPSRREARAEVAALAAEHDRGSSTPDATGIRDILLATDLQLSGREYSESDGHFYATRVFKGGREDGQPVFVGHGFYREGSGHLTVPTGTSISFYCAHREALPGLSGLAIEAGVHPGLPVETFREGDQVPDYYLTKPEATPPGGFSVFENSTTVRAQARLSDLLVEGMGHTHWAACREVQ